MFTMEKTCLCGYRRDTASPFATRFYHSYLTTSEGEAKGVVVVISPLVSLMINQVSALRERGVSAAIVSGNEGVDKELQATEKDLAKYKLLFSAPEAILGTDRWKEMLLKPPLYDEIVAVAIDEAHKVVSFFQYVEFISYLYTYFAITTKWRFIN